MCWRCGEFQYHKNRFSFLLSAFFKQHGLHSIEKIKQQFEIKIGIFKTFPAHLKWQVKQKIRNDFYLRKVKKV